ncbi:MAG: tyrosine-type recombinase/integrase [Oscillospiraceae bacterium]|nr:tyrosine-type recombinase/integrase [Oscillospiraceae bacterium]
MPRRGENIYKRKDGRWEGRVLQPGGKYRYVYARTYKEVKEKKKLYQESADITAPAAGQATRYAAEEFTGWLKGGLISRVKPSTYESYFRCVTGYVIPFCQERGHELISVQTAAEFSSRINQNQNISGAYKRKILTIYKTALRELLRDSGECSLILNAVIMPRAPGKDVQAFTMKEQRLIEKTVMESNDKRLLGIILCFYTGIRLGEVCGLKWGDIDLEAGAMVVSRTVYRVKNFSETGQKTSITSGTPKSARSIRKIPLPDFLLDLAQKYIVDSSNQNCYVLSGEESPLEPRKYQKLFQSLLKRSGVKSRKFHAIRHTFATRALELGVDIKTLSEILGHSSVSTTLNTYAHSMFDQKMKAIEKLNAMYVFHAETAVFAVTNSVVNI